MHTHTYTHIHVYIYIYIKVYSCVYRCLHATNAQFYSTYQRPGYKLCDDPWSLSVYNWLENPQYAYAPLKFNKYILKYFNTSQNHPQFFEVVVRYGKMIVRWYKFVHWQIIKLCGLILPAQLPDARSNDEEAEHHEAASLRPERWEGWLAHCGRKTAQLAGEGRWTHHRCQAQKSIIRVVGFWNVNWRKGKSWRPGNRLFFSFSLGFSHQTGGAPAKCPLNFLSGLLDHGWWRLVLQAWSIWKWPRSKWFGSLH